jgi:hypothetical protein
VPDGELFWEGEQDGELVGSYANWSDLAFDSLAVAYDCGVMYLQEGDNGEPGEWDDVDCDGMARVVCETW